MWVSTRKNSLKSPQQLDSPISDMTCFAFGTKAMKSVFGRLLGLSLVLITSVACSDVDATSECDVLLAVAAKPQIQGAILNWVDNKLKASLALDSYDHHGGVKPGSYRIPDMDFDWSLLDMSGSLRGIRIVTPNPLRKSPVIAVSFSDRSRVSIVVSTGGDPIKRVFDDSVITPVTERIAVYCFSSSETEQVATAEQSYP